MPDDSIRAQELLRVLLETINAGHETTREVTRTLATQGQSIQDVKTAVASLETRVMEAVEKRYKWLIGSLVGLVTLLIVALAGLAGVKLNTPAASVDSAVETAAPAAVLASSSDAESSDATD